MWLTYDSTNNFFALVSVVSVWQIFVKRKSMNLITPQDPSIRLEEIEEVEKHVIATETHSAKARV